MVFSNKNGLQVGTLYESGDGEYGIYGTEKNKLGKLKLKEQKGYVDWKGNAEVEFKALVVGSAFLTIKTYGGYNKIVGVFSVILTIIGIIVFIIKVLFK